MSPRSTRKTFDCLAFRQEQRGRIGRMLNAMTKEERIDCLRNVEITDPILRRFMERPPRGTLRKADVPPPESEARSPRHDN